MSKLEIYGRALNHGCRLRYAIGRLLQPAFTCAGMAYDLEDCELHETLKSAVVELRELVAGQELDKVVPLQLLACEVDAEDNVHCYEALGSGVVCLVMQQL